MDNVKSFIKPSISLRLPGVMARWLITAQTVPPGQCKAREKPEDRQQLRWSIAVSVYRRCGARCGGT